MRIRTTIRTCDRCGYSETYESSERPCGVWTGDGGMDLCPECSAKWERLVRNFWKNNEGDVDGKKTGKTEEAGQ